MSNKAETKASEAEPRQKHDPAFIAWWNNWEWNEVRLSPEQLAEIAWTASQSVSAAAYDEMKAQRDELLKTLAAKDKLLPSLIYEGTGIERARAQKAERENFDLQAEAEQSYRYLTHLLSHCAPVEPLKTLAGVATQIDNYIAGLRAERDELAISLSQCIESHQHQNVMVETFEAAFCEKHLENVPTSCAACERDELRQRQHPSRIDIDEAMRAEIDRLRAEVARLQGENEQYKARIEKILEYATKAVKKLREALEMSAAERERLRNERDNTTSVYGDILAQLPETFYADSPTPDRVALMVGQWQKAVEVNARLEREAEESRLEQEEKRVMIKTMGENLERACEARNSYHDDYQTLLDEFDEAQATRDGAWKEAIEARGFEPPVTPDDFGRWFEAQVALAANAQHQRVALAVKGKCLSESAMCDRCYAAINALDLSAIVANVKAGEARAR